MKLHANARLSVKGRELLVDRILMQGWPRPDARPHPHGRGLRNVRKSGDGGNRTHVRNRVKDGFYERSRRSDLVPR